MSTEPEFVAVSGIRPATPADIFPVLSQLKEAAMPRFLFPWTRKAFEAGKAAARAERQREEEEIDAACKLPFASPSDLYWWEANGTLARWRQMGLTGLRVTVAVPVPHNAVPSLSVAPSASAPGHSSTPEPGSV